MCAPVATRLAFAVTLVLPAVAVPSAAQCTPPLEGMTTWLALEGNTTDLLGSNHGTTVGTPSFAAGHVGGAIVFDSDDDGVTIPDAPSLNVAPTGFTAEFWMRGDPSQPQAQYLVVDKSHGWTDSTGWLFQGGSASGVLHFGIGAGGGGSANFPTVPSASSLLDGAYHHVAGTWNGSQIELFVDGVSQGTTGLSTPANNGRPVRMGYSWGGANPLRFFRGKVDELSIYARALTGPEVAAIAQAGSAGKCRPPASCTFRNGSGVNATGYDCMSSPVLGTTWSSTIATNSTTLTTVQVIASLPAQLALPGGEILVDPTAPMLLLPGTGVHDVPIPPSVSLVGALLPTQGLRVDTPGGVPTLVLLNAQDILIGF